MLYCIAEACTLISFSAWDNCLEVLAAIQLLGKMADGSTISEPMFVAKDKELIIPLALSQYQFL